ncbi:MAG: glutamine-hydrolyzing GMP synthase [Candidatus Cloacimonetes bacterium]|nr:glutamine-hydrolyzing GMP synthase [Candidatus Cloacimonadota bacterium]
MNKIAIVDFGGQYTHLIARRVRNLGVYSEIFHPEDFHFTPEIVGIIFSGGPQSVNAADAYRIDFNLATSPVPILGICYGHQLLAHMMGGTIESGDHTEYGFTTVTCDPGSVVFCDLDAEQQVWMSHGDHVATLPPGFRSTAHTGSIAIAAYESADGRFNGVQFHPEASHSKNGIAMIDNFLKKCHVPRTWNSEHFKEQLIRDIRGKAAGKKLILLLSGGVDSMVALQLCIAAVGNENIYSYHVNTGFMRKNESADLKEHFDRLGFDNINILDTEARFLKELAGVTDPETKRLIIGKLFVDIANEELGKLNLADNWMLVQGTIYPDTIESGDSKKSAKIKTHHNRVGEIEKLIEAGKVIEPLIELYKDEVRELGRELGLPEHLINRHPFPGPGLAIRIICSDTTIPAPDYDVETSELNHILEHYGMQGCILPIKSVGVQGDFRTYHHPAVIWAKGGGEVDWTQIRNASVLAVNSLKTVNRICFAHTQPASFSLDKLYLEKENLETLREVDAVMRRLTDGISEIWQMPVVQLPLSGKTGRLYVIRPVCSQDAMSADFYEMDFSVMKQIVAEAKKISGVGCILYDVTTKPPGTIEWE